MVNRKTNRDYRGELETKRKRKGDQGGKPLLPYFIHPPDKKGKRGIKRGKKNKVRQSTGALSWGGGEGPSDESKKKKKKISI